MDVRETFREHFNPTASLPELNSTIQIFQHIQKWKLVPIIVDRKRVDDPVGRIIEGLKS